MNSPLVPATFSELSANQSAVIGSPATVECRAEGDAPIRISWSRNGRPIKEERDADRFMVSS